MASVRVRLSHMAENKHPLIVDRCHAIADRRLLDEHGGYRVTRSGWRIRLLGVLSERRPHPACHRAAHRGSTFKALRQYQV
jgi:hypothetical protein